MNEQKHSTEDLKHEYADVTENIRHYSIMRCVIFSVFSAVMGGIAFFAFSDGGIARPAAILAKIGGLLVIFVFWVYEERASQMFSHFSKVAMELESKLGYRQISTRPPGKFPILEAKYTTRIFFILWTAFWIYALFTNL